MPPWALREDAPETDAAHVVQARQTSIAHCATHLELGNIRPSVLRKSAVQHLHLSICVRRCRAVCDRCTSCTPSETAVAIQRYRTCAQGTVTPGSTSSSANPGVPLSSAAGLSLVSCKHIIRMGMRPGSRHSVLTIPLTSAGPSEDPHHGLPRQHLKMQAPKTGCQDPKYGCTGSTLAQHAVQLKESSQFTCASDAAHFTAVP